MEVTELGLFTYEELGLELRKKAIDCIKDNIPDQIDALYEDLLFTLQETLPKHNILYRDDLDIFYYINKERTLINKLVIMGHIRYEGVNIELVGNSNILVVPTAKFDFDKEDPDIQKVISMKFLEVINTVVNDLLKEANLLFQFRHSEEFYRDVCEAEEFRFLADGTLVTKDLYSVGV